MIEKWRDVVGFEGLYEVSNTGKVKSIDRYITGCDGHTRMFRGMELAFHIVYGNSHIPRVQVQMSKEGKRYSKSVHRLVAQAFIPNPNNYPEVNHKDEDPSNNCVDNLEWCTNDYNHNYGTRNERQANALKKRVVMLDLDGNYLKTYECIKDAAQDIGGDPSGITKVCKGKQSNHHNYLFKYESDYIDANQQPSLSNSN